jgi:hypothetical protein
MYEISQTKTFLVKNIFTWTLLGALGTPFGTALTAVAAVNVSSMMKGTLQPTLFLAITLQPMLQNFLRP